MKKQISTLAIIVSALVAAACTGQTKPLTSQSVSPIAVPGAVVSPVVGPQAMPTPPTLSDQSRGGIWGRFVLSTTEQPLSNVAVYLGDYLPFQSNQQSTPVYGITIQQNGSPHVVTDDRGYFALMDVKPGSYALVLWTPFRSAVVADPKDPTKELKVVLEPGKVINIGEIVSNLP